MGNLYVARRPRRRGLVLPMKGNRANPSLIFLLDGADRSELDELVRAILAKGGVTEEAEVQAVVDRAEHDSEVRIKVAAARAEVRRLMRIRAAGGKLMQRGFRKWKQVTYPAVQRFEKVAVK